MEDRGGGFGGLSDTKHRAPGGGGSLGLYTTPQLSGGGADFWVCAK